MGFRNQIISFVRRRLQAWRRIPDNGVDLQRFEQTNNLLRDWYISYSEKPPSYSIIGFSRDRPMQLHALLSSYSMTAHTSAGITVLYYGSTPDYLAAYQSCFNCFDGNGKFRFVRQLHEASFKRDVLEILANINESRIAFLVDDIVFIREFDFRNFDCYDLRVNVPSLRLGKTIRYSYTTNRLMDLPSISDDNGFLKWVWRGNSVDWAYPLSVDGNIFLHNEIFLMLSRLDFSSPNTLESEMQMFTELYLDRHGVCYDLPRLVNLPLNRVQKDFLNRSGVSSSDFLLFKWMNGFSIDVKKIQGLVSNSVHSELDVSFVKRNA